MRQLRVDDETVPVFFADPLASSRIERPAMDAVWKPDEASGCRVVDVAKASCG